jgi:hypothetical protein
LIVCSEKTPKVTALDPRFRTSERAARTYVASRHVRLVPKEAFVRLAYLPGDQVQFDFKDVAARIAEVETKLHMFVAPWWIPRLYREVQQLFEELVLAEVSDERSNLVATRAEVPLLIIGDLGMCKLPASAAEDILEIIMRRYERASTIVTSNGLFEGWPKMSSDTPARHRISGSPHAPRTFHADSRQELRLHESGLAAPERKAKTGPQQPGDA